jgi:hypothetical protein
MIFFKLQFIEILLHIRTLSFVEQRNGLTNYKNCPCAYWNVLLWDNILKDNAIFCSNINKYMFNNFCKNHCTEEQSDIIFTRISQGDTHINYKNFDSFLRLLKDSEYINIINTLIDDLSIINKHSVTKSISLVHDKNFFIKRSKSCPTIIKYSNKYIKPKKVNNFDVIKFIKNIFVAVFNKLNIDKCYS